MIIIKIFFNHY